MTPETFIEQFETFAEAPNGVAKLRELILQLAVQGKLGTQDENDEPASELLSSLAMKFDDKAKRRRAASSIETDSPHAPPHDLPASWRWGRFDRVAVIASNLVQPTAYLDLPHVAPDNIEKGTGRLLPFKTVGEDGVRSGNHQFFAGQILYSKIRPNLSKAVLVDFDGLCSADMYPINAHIDAGYLLRFILSPAFLAMAVRNDTRVAMPKINQEELSAVLVAVPPLAEQRRIVAKVDQLLGLCDELAARQAARREARSALVGATLDRLVSARSSADQTSRHPACRGGSTASALLGPAADSSSAKAVEPLGQAQGRLMEDDAHRLRDHFDRLFDTATTIPQLRQAILQLAVQGQLVPQDPNDEPASVLTHRVDTFFARLVKEKQIRQPEPLAAIPSDYAPFALPKNWVWRRLGTIIRIASGDGLTSHNMTKAGEIPVYGGNGVTGYHDAHNVTEPTLVIGRVGFYCGSIHITPDRAWVTDNAFVTTFAKDSLDIDFLYWMLKATNLRENDSATAQPVISGKKVYPTIVPLPPLAEQKRIVSKVTELLSLCDALEAKLTQAESASTQLLSAAVADLLKHHSQ